MTRRDRSRTRRRVAAFLAVAIVVALAMTALAVLASGSAPSVPTSSPARDAPPLAAPARAPPIPASTASPAPLALSGVSAGSVVATAYLNYNATTRGNFPNSVYNWDAGGSAVDPTTDQLWIPEWPISVLGIPAPRSAPALVYDPSTNQTRTDANLTNTSAIAFDPLNGDLYATDPISNSVLVFDPTTDRLAVPPIPVGVNPMAIVYDPDTGKLFVANEGTNNIAVINGTTNTEVTLAFTSGTGPSALADDVKDGKLYIADSGASMVSVLNTTHDTAGTAIPVTNAPTSLAYSKSQNLLAVGMPGSVHLDIFDAKSQAPSNLPTVGSGVTSVVANNNGTEFALANGATPSLTLVNASTGAVDAVHPAAGNDPTLLSLDPTTGLVYAWSAVNRTTVSVDLAANSIRQVAPDLAAHAEAIAYDAASDRAFVADWNSDSVAILNASTLMTTEPPILFPNAPTSIVDDPATGWVYVAYNGGVAAVRGSTGSIVATNSALPGNNTQLVVDDASGLLWDVNRGSGLVSLELSTLTSGPVGGILVGSPNVRGLTLDPATNELFLVNLANSTLAVVNGSTGHEVGGAISGIPGLISVAYDSADEEVYALGRSVSIVDPLSHAIVGGPIGIAPHVVAWAIVYDPSREFLYVTSNDSLLPPWPGNVSAFDGSSVAASEDGSYVSIPVGQLPVDLQPVQLPGSAAPGSGEIFVTNLLSGTLSVIASAPAITFLAATPNPVDTGVRSTILLGYTGGAGPSMLSYTGLPAGCASADSTALLCTPTSAGSYAVIANVVDSLGVSASTSTVLSVAPALTVAAVLDTTSTGELDLGDALSASATVTGGSGPFNYSWEFGDGTGGYGADLAHSYAAVGVYYVTITVTDAGGGVSSTTATVSVVPLPSVSVSASPTNETDVGISLGFAVTVSGGTGAGNTSWAFDDGGTAFGASASHRFAVAGVYLVAVHYRDASGANASSFVPVVVNPALSAEYTVRPTPPGASVTTGTTLEFNTSISGGTAPYTIVWGFDDGSYGYGVSSSHSYGQAGTYTVTLFVEDAVGGEWNTTYRLAVASPSSAPTFGSEFEDGLVLGLLVGAVAAAAVLFVAARSKKRPPAPPTAFVPPAARTEVAPPEPWREA